MVVEPLKTPMPLCWARDVHERAEALVQRLAEDPELRARSQMSKTAVLRLTLLHRLGVLKMCHQKQTKPKASRDKYAGGLRGGCGIHRNDRSARSPHR
jgi:hypothetical protein